MVLGSVNKGQPVHEVCLNTTINIVMFIYYDICKTITDKFKFKEEQKNEESEVMSILHP